tara:strand:- start:766 stop:1713 length:948 start_codon:yes stop_codon:yes gene_type:complete
MQNTEKSQYNRNNDEIDLLELFKVVAKGRWIIGSLTTFTTIVALYYSLSLPNIYQSSALLNPLESQDTMSGALKSYGGIASLAGINLPAQGGSGNVPKAIKKIASLSFFENNIMPHIDLPELMAVKYWDYETNSLVFDENIYNKKSKTWVRNFSYPQKEIPSSQESFEVFKDNHFSINEDKKNGFITLTIRHQSPYIAKKWSELIINQINIFYREKDKESAIRSVNYLNTQIAKASLSEIKQVLAQLLQTETQKLTLIESNKSYVFDFIDPPAVMEKKSDPQRAIICFLGLLLGLIMSSIIVLVRHYAIKTTTSI